MAVNLIDQFDRPITLGPGRADLRYSSTGFADGIPLHGRVGLIGDEQRSVSFARLVATQQWVGTAIHWMLASAVRVPLKVYRRTGSDSRERVAAKDHPLARAVVEPWERGSQADLVQALLGGMLVHGNSLLDVTQGANDLLRFEQFDWRFSNPIRPWRNTIAGWVVDTDENERTISADTMLHMAWWSPLGPLGISPLQQLGVTISIEDAAQRYQQALFQNGARPPSAVTASDQFLGLDRDERAVVLANLREDLTTLYAGPENSGRPALLPPGLSWDIVGHSAVEAELIDQRKVAREEIAAAYRIAPSCLGIVSESKNRDMDRQASYMDGLLPMLITIEQRLNAQLVRSFLREDDLFVEFDASGLVRGDRLAEVNALRESIASALMTPNEARGVLNLPASDLAAMDQHFLPRNNLIPIDQPYVADGMHLPAATPVDSASAPAADTAPAGAVE
jgi:HK97 family phage portal protein